MNEVKLVCGRRSVAFRKIAGRTTVTHYHDSHYNDYHYSFNFEIQRNDFEVNSRQEPK